MDTEKNHSPSRTFQVNRLKNRFDNAPKQTQQAWPAIKPHLLRFSTVADAKPTDTKECRDKQKDGPAMIFQTMSEGKTRAKENALSAWAITLDVEQQTVAALIDTNTGEIIEPESAVCPIPFEEAIANAEKTGLTFAAWTTYTHTPENPRYRFVFPLDADIHLDALHKASLWAASHILDLPKVRGILPIDPASWSRARLMYLPRKPAYSDYHSAYAFDGRFLDVDSVLSLPDLPKQQRRADLSNSLPIESPHTSAPRSSSAKPRKVDAEGFTAYGKTVLDKFADELRHTQDGGRNNKLNDFALRCFRLALGKQMPASAVSNTLQQAAMASGLPLDEISKTLQSAFLAAQQEGPALPPEREPTRQQSGKQGESSPPRQPIDQTANDDVSPFYFEDKYGLFFVGVGRSKDGNPYYLEPLKLSGKFEVAGYGITESGHHSRILDWSYLGRHVLMNLPMELVGERAGWALLRKLGLVLSSNRRNLEKLADFIQADHVRLGKTPDIWHVTTSGGWQFGAYVLPNGEIIGQPDKRVFLENTQFKAAQKLGTVESWRDTVGHATRNNTRCMLALGFAFAAPLARLVGVKSGGVHIFGDSSSGKTSALNAALSVFGDEILTWNATAIALTNAAAARNDGLMGIDEVGQGDAEAISKASYTICNETSRMQSNADSRSNREQMSWRVLIVSTGEKDLGTMLKSGGVEIHAGQEVRLASIPSDAGKDLGAFDTLNGFASSGDLADFINKAAAVHRGMVGRAFIEHIQPQLDAIKRRLNDSIRKGLEDPKLTGQRRRVLERFVLAGEALEIATDAGLTGWEKGEGMKACLDCFDTWEQRQGKGSFEDRKILDQVQYWLSRNHQSRFIDVDQLEKEEKDFEDGKAPSKRDMIHNAAGYKKRDKDGNYYHLIEPAVFKEEVAKGFEASKVASVLIRAGMLEKGTGKIISQHRIPSRAGRPYFYKIVRLSPVSDD